MKIKEIEALPRNMVGDDKKPNVFFVSDADDGVILMSRTFAVAYDFWKKLPINVESALEDRQYGVICDRSPDEKNPTKIVTHDDSQDFLKRHPSCRWL